MRTQEMREITFQIDPVPPYRLDLTVWVLKRRPDNAWDRWDGRVFARVLVPRDRPVEVQVRQQGSVDQPTLEMRLAGRGLTPEAAAFARDTVATMLGAHVDLSGFARLAQRDAVLGALVARLRGTKPTRFPGVYEGLVNAVCCQQITLTSGLRLLGRLVAACGPRLDDRPDAPQAFPGPGDVLTVGPEGLATMGFSRQKARALLELSARLHEGSLSLDGLDQMGDETVRERLLAIRGIGRWSAEYVMLRALGRLHVFPGDDVGARNNLRRWLGHDEALDYAGVRRALAVWSDYAGLLYFYLLLQRLEEMGYFDGTHAT